MLNVLDIFTFNSAMTTMQTLYACCPHVFLRHIIAVYAPGTKRFVVGVKESNLNCLPAKNDLAKALAVDDR